MEATGLRLLARVHEEIVPDELFSTWYEHRCGDHIVAVCHGDIPSITLPRPLRGDTLTVKVHSGTLTGTVVDDWQVRGCGGPRPLLYGLDASWSGSYGGLMGGLSGVVEWKLANDGGTVVTSASDTPVPLSVYIAAQDATSRYRFRAPYDADEDAREAAVRARHEAAAARIGVVLDEHYRGEHWHLAHREVLREELAARLAAT